MLKSGQKKVRKGLKWSEALKSGQNSKNVLEVKNSQTLDK
jgi:hypothetical protein